jgi:hypothetical protein
LVLLDWDLGHFKQEIYQKHRYWGNVLVKGLEQVSELFSGHINEIGLPDFIWLMPDPVFTFNIIVFAHELQELEGSSVGDYAFLVVDLLIGGGGFEDIFSEDIFFIDVVKVIVVNGSGRKGIVRVFFDISVIDVFKDEFAQF